MKSMLTLLRQGNLLESVSAFLLIALSLTVALNAYGAEDAENGGMYSTSAGSGDKYRTTVERSTHGELGHDDMRQVTVLASRVLLHINAAVESLIDDASDEALRQIEYAQAVARIVRDLLPLSTVATRVEDAKGEVVYSYTENVQDDRIPIYKSTLMVEVVKPIIEVRKDEASLQGLALQDADFIYTSALLDLGYVERKLHRAAELIAEKDQALRQLTLAQTEGLALKTNREDTSLAKAQAALQLAERMVGENKVESAKANLQLARLHLESYRSIANDPKAVEISTLRKRIDELSDSLQEQGMSTAQERDESRGLIQGFWETVTGWMADEPGEAQVTDSSGGETENSGAS